MEAKPVNQTVRLTTVFVRNSGRNIGRNIRLTSVVTFDPKICYIKYKKY